MFLKVKGAYGRRYISIEDCLADWVAGKDFEIINGPYFSIRDKEYMQERWDEVIVVLDTEEEHTLFKGTYNLLDDII